MTATPSDSTWIVTGIDTREPESPLMSRPDEQDETANPAACAGTNDSLVSCQEVLERPHSPPSPATPRH